MNPQNGKSNRRPGGWKTFTGVALALSFTAVLFLYLARNTEAEDWRRLLTGLEPWALAAYLGLFLLSMFLKAWRYQVLLRASGLEPPPGRGDLMVVSLVTNLFVDLLPARSGSLAYVVVLNRKLGVETAACLSSFAFSFIFDVVGMLPLILAAIYLAGPESAGGQTQVLWIVLGVLTLASLLAVFLMDRILLLAASLLGAGDRKGDSGGILAKAAHWLGEIAADVKRVKERGVYGRLLWLSVLLRFTKYISLFILLGGLAAGLGPAQTHLTFPLVLFALVAGEATASLPISGIAGFGAYEGVMMATLHQAGIPSPAADMLPFALHLTTQTIDYTLGGLCLLYLMASQRFRRRGGDSS